MADVGKVYPSEINLLKKELEVQGELLSRERLEREAEIGELKAQMSAIKHFLEQRYPEFSSSFEDFVEERRKMAA